MTTETYRLELITPCFCAGADQSTAEIRAAAIRGKLRWWFRVLGGTWDQESEVFGSVGRNSCVSSSVAIRVKEFAANGPWTPVQFDGRSNTGYLLYFAKASGDGCRWNSKGAFPAGSRFEIQIMWHRRLSEENRKLFDLACQCFLMLGSLGLRSTRGMGCFQCDEIPFSEGEFNRYKAMIKRRAPEFLADMAQFHGPEPKLFDALGAQLRGLRTGYPPGFGSSLGSSNPRQASAVYLRPVVEADGCYGIVVFEAPKKKVLASNSWRAAPRLGEGIPAPAYGK